MMSQCRPRSCDRTASTKRHKMTSTSDFSCTNISTITSSTTSTSSLPQAVSEEQLVQRITVAFHQAFRDQPSTSTQDSSTIPSQSAHAAAQCQADSAPLFQESVSEAIYQITGVNQEAETPTDENTSKGQFVSVVAPLGSYVSTRTKNKIWDNEYADLGLLLTVQSTDEIYIIKLQKTGGGGQQVTAS